MGFPTKNDHFGVFLGYYHLRKQTYIIQTLKGSQLDNMFSTLECFQSLRFDFQISSHMVSLDFHVNVFFGQFALPVVKIDMEAFCSAYFWVLGVQEGFSILLANAATHQTHQPLCSYGWCFRNPAITSWYVVNIPLFTGFHTFSGVVFFPGFPNHQFFLLKMIPSWLGRSSFPRFTPVRTSEVNEL